MNADSQRLDIWVTRLWGMSRVEAQSLIKGGFVTVAGRVADKPGVKIGPDAAQTVMVTGGRKAYVGRGGVKLAAALDHFGIDLSGCVCLDVGASTGGFTDCMLQRGAVRVYAVENGTDQLAPVLAQDPRVISYERTDIRTVTTDYFHAPIAFAAVDVSFISLTKVLAAVVGLLAEEARLVCLIKPQFEAGRGFVGKRGVVKDAAIHRRVIAQVGDYAAGIGLTVAGVVPTPPSEGNREFLCYMLK